MADKSKIEWTDASFNPIRARNLKTGKVGWYCEHATTGCEFCYAEGFNKRLGTGLAFKPGHRKDVEIFLDQEMLTQPLRWKKPRMIFVCSMTDLFADFVPDDWIDKVFAVMALAPQHTFQVLTKRAARMRDYCLTLGRHHERDRVSLAMKQIFAEHGFAAKRAFYTLGDIGWHFKNIWLGVSTERQQEADERIPLLLQTPGAVRFISAEPLLGPIDLTASPAVGRTGWLRPLTGDHQLQPVHADHRGAKLDWVIVGGESGHGYRPMAAEWAYGLRDQCIAANVPVFVKQMAGKKPIPDDLMTRQFPMPRK